MQCFDCATARKQFEIISDTHEHYFRNITEDNISEICIRKNHKLNLDNFTHKIQNIPTAKNFKI